MAFFDELNRAFTSTTNKVGQMAGDASEIARLKLQVTTANDKLRKLYTQLGKAYYASHPETTDSEITNMINEIDATLLAIKEAEDNISGRKASLSSPTPAPVAPVNGIICPVCGRKVAEDAKFCTGCGNRIIRPKTIYCTTCGKAIDPGAKFCTNCGTLAPVVDDEPFDELAVDFELTENGVLQFDSNPDSANSNPEMNEEQAVEE